MALIATPGAANANSYVTVNEADAYNDSRLHSETWTDATNPEKEAALIDATRLIDAAFVWTGSPSDAIQALTWPRTGMVNRNGFAIASNVIPQELKNATAELARQLIDGDITANDDAEKSNISSVSAGPISLSFRSSKSSSSDIDSRDADIIAAGPEFGWMARWMPDEVPLLMVPSWYTRPLVRKRPFFRVYR